MRRVFGSLSGGGDVTHDEWREYKIGLPSSIPALDGNVGLGEVESD